jgi:hypothetical protein
MVDALRPGRQSVFHYRFSTNLTVCQVQGSGSWTLLVALLLGTDFFCGISDVLTDFSCFLLVADVNARDSTIILEQFTYALAKFRKASISCIMSVYPSARMEHLGSHWTEFCEI